MRVRVRARARVRVDPRLAGVGGEGESGRGVRSPAWSNYSSPTPGLAHAS